MILNYNPARSIYVLHVRRSEGADKIQRLMQEYGFNFSIPASTAETAVLFTREPYAAASFIDCATPAAALQLKGTCDEIAASRALDAMGSYWCPPEHELWPFQRANIAYALRRRHTLVGDQPGLGKTEVAICFANEIKASHVLVICPANIRQQWERRIRDWSRLSWEYGRRDCAVHAITSSRRGTAPPDEFLATWNIVSYDLARTPAIGRALARYRYDLLILDEAHYLKSIDAERTRAVFGGGDRPNFGALANQCERILALTGTPLPNRPREAYTLARGLCFDSIDWLSEEGFRSRFNPSLVVEGHRTDGSPYRYVDERSGRHAELQNRLRANFMVRHLKRDVMPQLKMPAYDLIQVEETGAVKQALAAESLLDIDPENLEGADVAIWDHVAVARRLMGIALAPQVAHYVDMLVDGGEEKLVVFAWHIEVLNLLEHHWSKHGCLRIDGSTSPAQKDRRIKQFITDPAFKIILGNLLSLGTGTDGLQHAACHALIAEPSWTPGDNIQCFDRLDRGGQRRAVQGDIFVAPRSIAERVLASALRKLSITNLALDARVGL